MRYPADLAYRTPERRDRGDFIGRVVQRERHPGGMFSDVGYEICFVIPQHQDMLSQGLRLPRVMYGALRWPGLPGLEDFSRTISHERSGN